MQQRAQIENLGHFIEFGWFDWSDIAYNDSTKCFSAFANGYMSQIIYWLCIVSISYAKKSSNRVSGRSPSLVGSIGLILHIMIVQNVFSFSQWLLVTNN